jgi:hypothetical protein
VQRCLGGPSGALPLRDAYIADAGRPPITVRRTLANFMASAAATLRIALTDAAVAQAES